jgi:hypothetical protein
MQERRQPTPVEYWKGVYDDPDQPLMVDLGESLFRVVLILEHLPRHVFKTLSLTRVSLEELWLWSRIIIHIPTPHDAVYMSACRMQQRHAGPAALEGGWLVQFPWARYSGLVCGCGTRDSKP